MADKKEQLKQLMKKAKEQRGGQQSATNVQKINSPYAKYLQSFKINIYLPIYRYNNSGQLMCIPCNEIIKSEVLIKY